MEAFISNSPEQTRGLAHNFAKSLKGDETILLSGALGAGKTEFVKGLASGLGIKEKITSPTFLLHKSFPYKKAKRKFTFHHIDLYRLGENIKNLGLADIFSQKHRVVIIEWPERIKKIQQLTTKRPIKIIFQHGKTKNTRKIKIAS